METAKRLTVDTRVDKKKKKKPSEAFTQHAVRSPKKNEARWRLKVAKKLLRLLIARHGEEKRTLK